MLDQADQEAGRRTRRARLPRRGAVAAGWRRLQIAEQQIRRSIDVWEADDLPAGGAVTREQIEESLADPNGAYRRLRRLMDAWCALWFWPLTDLTTSRSTVSPWSSRRRWSSGSTPCRQLLGRAPEAKKPLAAGQMSLGSCDDLGGPRRGRGQRPPLRRAVAIDDVLTRRTRGSSSANASPSQQGFFHWELDFASVFARGGFDLQVGNPPWVRPTSDVDALLAEGDPWWQLAVKPTQI